MLKKAKANFNTPNQPSIYVKKFMFILKHIDIIFQIDDTGIFTQNCYCNSDNCNNYNNCAENIDCVDS